MSVITDLHRLENENMMAWQIRCCLAKRRKETDMDWVEIRDMLGLGCFCNAKPFWYRCNKKVLYKNRHI